MAKDIVDEIIRYEDGDMTDDEMIKFFQVIIDDGSIRNLQGHYWRTAQALIDAGHCHCTVKST